MRSARCGFALLIGLLNLPCARAFADSNATYYVQVRFQGERLWSVYQSVPVSDGFQEKLNKAVEDARKAFNVTDIKVTLEYTDRTDSPKDVWTSSGGGKWPGAAAIAGRPAQSTSGGAAPRNENAGPNASAKSGGGRKILVRVYRLVNNKWVEQPDRKYETESEAKAKDYYGKVKTYPGWTATWNAPGVERPKVTMPEMRIVDPGAYNAPKTGTESRRIGYDDGIPKGGSTKAKGGNGYYAVYVWWPGQYPDKNFWSKQKTRAEAEAAAKRNGWVELGVGKYVIQFFPEGTPVPDKLP